MKPMANRLKNELSQSINYTESDLEKDLKVLQQEDVMVYPEETIEIIEETNKATIATPNEVVIEVDIYEQIEKAHQLFEKNIIMEEEFLELKKNLLIKLIN